MPNVRFMQIQDIREQIERVRGGDIKSKKCGQTKTTKHNVCGDKNEYLRSRKNYEIYISKKLNLLDEHYHGTNTKREVFSWFVFGLIMFGVTFYFWNIFAFILVVVAFFLFAKWRIKTTATKKEAYKLQKTEQLAYKNDIMLFLKLVFITKEEADDILDMCPLVKVGDFAFLFDRAHSNLSTEIVERIFQVTTKRFERKPEELLEFFRYHLYLLEEQNDNDDGEVYKYLLKFFNDRIPWLLELYSDEIFAFFNQRDFYSDSKLWQMCDDILNLKDTILKEKINSL